jgi:hypothetical protein
MDRSRREEIRSSPRICAPSAAISTDISSGRMLMSVASSRSVRVERTPDLMRRLGMARKERNVRDRLVDAHSRPTVAGSPGVIERSACEAAALLWWFTSGSVRGRSRGRGESEFRQVVCRTLKPDRGNQAAACRGCRRAERRHSDKFHLHAHAFRKVLPIACWAGVGLVLLVRRISGRCPGRHGRDTVST